MSGVKSIQISGNNKHVQSLDLVGDTTCLQVMQNGWILKYFLKGSQEACQEQDFAWPKPYSYVLI